MRGDPAARLGSASQPYRRSARTSPGPASATMPGPLVLDLIAALVESGAPPQAALRGTGAGLTGLGDPRGEKLLALADLVTDPASGDLKHDDATAALAEALTLAARSGLPPSALVRRAAAEERRRQAAARAAAIHRLEVLLVIPGAVCLLPAFVLLGIVPLVIRLVAG
ncbi:type II secretion system F family protein [Kineosporia sp. J2-2]|uniref:Type II secretion system F family protein n=1 Tax=Kineosporia corallincola TaxID=2835133 RepID=A0ABS5TCL0_9ACTN|nr:type II secretion system F family protein [Kineosporia corallincola]MBT0767364.1 type II secretion system F family protein [Kineosporia corallincola]